MRERIRQKVRTDLSPRFVPDAIVQIEEVPRTLNGKKVEVPVKRVLMGLGPSEALSTSMLKNPDAMEFFVDYRSKVEISG